MFDISDNNEPEEMRPEPTGLRFPLAPFIIATLLVSSGFVSYYLLDKQETQPTPVVPSASPMSLSTYTVLDEGHVALAAKPITYIPDAETRLVYSFAWGNQGWMSPEVQIEEMKKFISRRDEALAGRISDAVNDPLVGFMLGERSLVEFINPTDTPATYEYLLSLLRDVDIFTARVQSRFGFARPSDLDASVAPVVTPPAVPAVPDAVATRAALITAVLAEALPVHSAVFQTEASRIAMDRVIGGLAYPASIEFSAMLAREYLLQTKRAYETGTMPESAIEKFATLRLAMVEEWQNDELSGYLLSLPAEASAMAYNSRRPTLFVPAEPAFSLTPPAGAVPENN